MPSRRLRECASIAAFVGLLIFLTSCEGLLGPDARPTMYVLRSIGGTVVPVNLNDFIDDGTSARMIWLFGDGDGDGGRVYTGT